MSAVGHSRRFARVFSMSGLAPTADVPDTAAIFALGPIPEVANLFDHPVDADAERRWKFERCRSGHQSSAR